MLRVLTLGGLSVTHPDRPLGRAAVQPRPLALLAVLARAGERGATREALTALLWPDADEERARRSLAQAVYALRRDLGDDLAIVGTQELRLDPDRASSDVAEYAAHVRAGRLDAAAALYAGPFLAGFRLPGAPALERWADDERRAVAREHARVLERLATAAERAGDHVEAAARWRALAALDPLDARVAVRLMETLDAAGDRAAALAHARVYEALVRQELELPPDPSVVAVAERLRQAPARVAAAAPTPAPPAPTAPAPEPTPASHPAPAAAPAAPPAATEARPRAPRRWVRAGLLPAVLAAALGAVAIYARRTPAHAEDDGGPPRVAVGLIADFRTAGGGATRPLADMLATNLARVDGVQVISSARVQELLHRSGGADTAAGSFVSAARQAGAAELVDGTLYARADGTLRLDLRRVHLASGAVRAALTVEGRDLFALADSGTARLLRGMRLAAPRGSVADVTTRSETAYRLYAQGLQAFHTGDAAGAEKLLAEALRADSTFAMAAFYYASSLYSSDAVAANRAMERAAALSARASERDRLFIRAVIAANARTSALEPIADSLVTRHPTLVEGHHFRGVAAHIRGDYLGARRHLERAIAMDSLGVGSAAGPCMTCSAMDVLTHTLHAADSLPAAERAARRWVRLRPEDPQAWSRLAEVLARMGRWPEAELAQHKAGVLGPGLETVRYFPLFRAYLRDDLAEAERLARAQLDVGTAARRTEALSELCTVLRYRGRLREAQDFARRYAERGGAPYRANPELGPAPLGYRLDEAVVHLEAGRPLESARVFEAIANAPPHLSQERDALLRQRAWLLTHAMTARALAGDTAGLRARADDLAATLRAVRLTHPHYRHYPAGLLALARGDTTRAIAELRAAITSYTVGYTRASSTLARLLLATGRPDQAVAVLQAGLRGDVAGQNLYVTRPSLHEALAEAWDAVARTTAAPAARDSAATHWRVVADAWADGDPSFAARAARARQRLAAR